MSFIVRRLVFYIVAAWVALTVNFFIPRAMPGNAVQAIMAKFPSLQPSAYKALEAMLGVGHPGSIWSQYGSYLDDVAHFNFGTDVTQYPAPVSTLLAETIPWTLILVGSATVIAFIVGTGLGGGIVQAGHVIKGAAGMAGELGHVPIPLDDLLDAGQPMPLCNCGQAGDAESVASLTGIQNNLLPYWLTRYQGHELNGLPIGKAAKLVRKYAEDGDEMALAIFRQQAIAIGRLFHIAANFLDPDAYFLGGGVVEAAPHFRDWFFAEVRAATSLRAEQARAAQITLVPDLDMAGARGSAFAARDWLISERQGVLPSGLLSPGRPSPGSPPCP